jgi:hypothetical protein
MSKESTVTRSLSRITSLALAITAVAVPAASANPLGSGDAVKPSKVESQSISKVTPDARDAARPAPAIDRVSPDARDNGRREPAPVVVSQPPVVATDGFDWTDAGIGAAGGLAILTLAGGMGLVATQRRRVRTA